MQETLFHPAFWMPLALAVFGIAVFVYGNARVKAGIRWAGAGIVALSVAWMAIAYFIDTFTETCVKRTDAIVAAVEDAKWDELAKLLDKNTRLAALRGPEEISKTAEHYAGMAQLKVVRILSHDVQSIPNGVDVSITAYVEAQTPSTSTWTFSYEQRSDGILLRQITPVRLNNQSLDQVEKVIGQLAK